MKKLFLIAFALCTTEFTWAQTNTFPATGNAGIGTTSPGVALDINVTNPQIRMQGASSSWQNSDILIKRTNSGDQWMRSPNIAFADAATGTSAYIQSYQGNIQFWPSGTKTATITSGGLFGINTANPWSTFQVNDNGSKLSIGSANTTTLLGTSYIGFNAGRMTNNTWRFDPNTGGSGGALMYSDVNGNLNFAAVPTQNSGLLFYLNDSQIKTYVSMQLTSGGILRAKRVKVETTGWFDYVFDENYKLPTLASVNSYIQKNHHLPEIPSAAEVIADGHDLGEMNKLLLKKVEELTLYLIKKDEEDKQKDIKINKLRKQVDQLIKTVQKK